MGSRSSLEISDSQTPDRGLLRCKVATRGLQRISGTSDTVLLLEATLVPPSRHGSGKQVSDVHAWGVKHHEVDDRSLDRAKSVKQKWHAAF